MTTATMLYKNIYKLLTENKIISEKIGGRVFSNHPENVTYPIIRIADISINVTPYTGYQGVKSLIKIEIISKTTNNLECLELMDLISQMFSDLSTINQNSIFDDYKLINANIYRDKGGNCWLGEMEVEANSFVKH